MRKLTNASIVLMSVHSMAGLFAPVFSQMPVVEQGVYRLP